MFDESYQRELLTRLTNGAFLKRLGKLIHPEHFDPEYEPVVRGLLEHFKRTGRPVTKGQLNQLCSRHGVKPQPTSVSDFTFDEAELLYWSRYRIMGDALAKAQGFREQGKFERAVEAVSECRKRFPVSLEEDQAPDMLKSRLPIPQRRNLISVGIKELDKCLEGGIGGSDLAAVLAPTSGGKTSWLIHVAAEAALLGHKVYYITLEVPRTEIEAKLRRRITGEIRPSRNQWIKTAGKISRKGGRLQVREAPPHSISVAELDARLEDDVNLLIVDYADYLRLSDRAVGFDYHDLGALYNSLKALAMDRRIPVWTASQVNRQAYGASKIGLQDIESSLKKAMVVDQALCLNQTSDHPDPATGEVTGEINVAKNRHGVRHLDVGVTINWSLSTFIEGKWG